MQTVTFNGRRMRKPMQVTGVSTDNNVEQFKFILPEYKDGIATLKLLGYDLTDKVMLAYEDDGWIWTVNSEHIKEPGVIYGQIQILANDEIVWQSYVFSIKISETLPIDANLAHSYSEFLRVLERMVYQKPDISEVQTMINKHGGVELLRFEDKNEFPATGSDNVLYLDMSANQIYFWDDGEYVCVVGSNSGTPVDGSGNMHTSVYDTNANAIVDRAEVADALSPEAISLLAGMIDNEFIVKIID